MWEWENGIKDSYESTYTQIMGVNAVLDGVDDVEGSVENRVYFALSAAVVAVEKQKMYMAMALMVRNNAI